MRTALSRWFRLRFGAAWLLFAMLPMLALPVAAASLQGSWREASPADRVDGIRSAPVSPAEHRFDPAWLTVIPAGSHGSWIRLQLPADVGAADAANPASNDRWVLVVHDPGLQTFSFFPAHGDPVIGARLLDPRSDWQGHGRIGFLLDEGPGAASMLLLRIDSSRLIASPLRFSLVREADFDREDARWLAMATACFAIMAAMAVMALLFAIELRDIAFLYYAAYVLAYAMILLIQTGYVAAPLEWSWIADYPNAWARGATALSVLSATLFVSRFAELKRFAPRMRVAVLGLGIATAFLMALGSLPIAALAHASALLINPLLILGGPLILSATVLAFWRGSRYAGFFLIGWTPLLVVTVLGSAQVFGVLPTWTWLGDSNLIAGAFEALVLSLGLADRALALRRDRDIAQALADTDGLTGVFNRRGLDRRVAEMVERAQRQRSPLTLLFLDLDRFKLLNDRQGHAAGDAALIAVTRLMRSDMRVQDVLGRYGGEEFLAALPACNRAAASAIAERIRADLHALAIPAEDGDNPLTASIGIACLRRGDDAGSLIARADAAMYAAKRSGGNRVATDVDAEAAERAA
jgi:diguanylate cyclase (GGDEF)-like protein